MAQAKTGPTDVRQCWSGSTNFRVVGQILAPFSTATKQNLVPRSRVGI